MSPFRSKAQQGYLEAKKPSVAKKFEAETPKSAYKHLPKKVGAGQASGTVEMAAEVKPTYGGGRKKKVGVGAGFIGNVPPPSQIPMSLQGAMSGGPQNPLMGPPPVMGGPVQMGGKPMGLPTPPPTLAPQAPSTKKPPVKGKRKKGKPKPKPGDKKGSSKEKSSKSAAKPGDKKKPAPSSGQGANPFAKKATD